MLFCTFFAITARLRHESGLLWRAESQCSDFLFFFLKFDRVFRQTERDGISAIKFEAGRTETLLRDDFVAVAITLRFPLENVS